jgi:hypothetical protein
MCFNNTNHTTFALESKPQTRIISADAVRREVQTLPGDKSYNRKKKKKGIGFYHIPGSTTPTSWLTHLARIFGIRNIIDTTARKLSLTRSSIMIVTGIKTRKILLQVGIKCPGKKTKKNQEQCRSNACNCCIFQGFCFFTSTSTLPSKAFSAGPQSQTFV